MLFNRTTSRLVLGLLLLMAASPCLAQGPLGMQIFAPADVSTYGGGEEPNEGYFFQFDGLYWSITPPKVHTVGSTSTSTQEVFYNPLYSRFQSSTLDTSVFKSEFSPGNRIEFGRMEDRNGWMVGIYQLRDQTQDYLAPSADIVFNDEPNILYPPDPQTRGLLYGNVENDPDNPPAFRPLPTNFTNVYLENAIDTWGVEANYIHRFLTGHHGGTFELFLGARYFEFNDNFNVSTGTSSEGLLAPSFLGGSYWNTEAQNHVVGPQVGLRWFKKQGRWMFNAEGRFLAGINYQNIQQQVSIGPNLNPGQTADGTYTPFQPLLLAPTSATHVEYAREFTPTVELRVEGRYQITRAISFHAGWTGTWMDGIARASSVVVYDVPAMGIDPTDNRENVFMNGVTIGFDVNR